jgi:hypothetical protein
MQLHELAVVKGAEVVMVREGGSHSVFGVAGLNIYIPRHREINEETAKAILRRVASHLERSS